ncbi:MAG: hypothetical protein N2C12_09180, partial [Planctomycetales bacterium]
MNSQQPPISDPEMLDEEITAYLDGELDGDRLRELEQRLADDESFRDRVQTMQASWDMLDELPRDEVGHDFAASTVEMVATSVLTAAKNSEDNWGKILLRQWAIVFMSVLAACLVGFLLSSGFDALLNAMGIMKTPNDRLLEELPIIENLEKYQLVDDIGFLRAFGELSAMTDDWPTSPLPDLSETTSERRGRLQSMPPAEKKRLAANMEQFEKMS